MNIALLDDLVSDAESHLMSTLIDLAKAEDWEKKYIARLESMASVLSIDLSRKVDGD